MDRENLKKLKIELRIGDRVRIKRIWINQPDSYIEGIILGFSDTRWDEDYRIVELLSTDGKIFKEPIHIKRDYRCFEVLI